MEKILIPLPHELKENFPALLTFVEKSRSICRHILSGKDSRKVFIVGPCSIHDRESAMHYALRLKILAEEVADSCILVMRVYIEKSRTAKGWKGFLYDPHLNGSNEIQTGLEWSRELFLKLAELEVPCATEFVNPLIAPYFEDLITWGFIGARTTYSQTHRQLASSLSMPVGFKNSLDGNIKSAIHSVESAEESHTFLSTDSYGKLSAFQTLGNPDTHIVLRGSCDTTNYDAHSIEEALQLLNQYSLPQRVMIDCSHGNSQRNATNQKNVFENTLEQILKGNDKIFGWMIESHLKEGNQSLNNPLEYGISITDPCLDWKTTEELIRAAHSALSLYPSEFT
jgi:3-deoxy-7-phosphoheptulonate synthase